MEIKIADYILTNSLGISKFDLTHTYIAKSGLKKGEIIKAGVVYGVTLRRCVEVIMQYRLDNELETLELEEFVQKYELITKKLYSDIKESFSKVQQ